MMNLTIAPKFGIWGGPNGGESCMNPGGRLRFPSPQIVRKTRQKPVPEPVQQSSMTEKEMITFVAQLTKSAKLVKVTKPGNGKPRTYPVNTG
jgi:hypothetical protein